MKANGFYAPTMRRPSFREAHRAVEGITEQQMRKIHAMAKNREMSHKDLHDLCESKFAVKSLKCQYRQRPA